MGATISRMIRRFASLLPAVLQQELRRLRFLSRAKRGRFSPNEPEAEMLDRFVSPGDWAVDIGANVGQYTLLLSGLVGRSGRVLAFEPITNTIATLASIVARHAPWQNVSIFNLAVSNEVRTLSFDLPVDPAGLYNYELAAAKEGGAITVLAVSIDSMKLPHRISFVKIDAEGHETEFWTECAGPSSATFQPLSLKTTDTFPTF
jgi:FkbM family methyltransferase